MEFPVDVAFFFPSRNSLYEQPNTGIVTVATNGYDASFLLNTTITKGKFDGPIYIISDTNEFSNPPPMRVKVVLVATPADSLFAVDMKSRVFQLIENATASKSEQPERLLYLDADMGVNLPIYNTFLSTIDWRNNSDCSVYILRERWYTKSLWNTGTMLLDRYHSADFLKAWHQLIKDNHDLILSQDRYSKDQWALMQLLDQGKFKVCPLPDQVSFVADFFSHHIWGDESTTFTHWTSAKRLSDHNFKRSAGAHLEQAHPHLRGNKQSD